MTPTGVRHQATEASSRRCPDDGPFVLEPLLEAVPLSSEGNNDAVKIVCVDFWDNNLYIGTSASEVLHFVQVPSNVSSASTSATYILASRLSPPGADSSVPQGSLPGVQQILLLPRIGKACILCNGTVSFFSLPELSPIFSPVKGCNWIGGTDLDESIDDIDANDDRQAVILLSTNQRIQVVRIRDEPRAIKKISYGGTKLFIRRGTIACVADGDTYSLLDIERQLKIPLMSISSLSGSPHAEDTERAQLHQDDAGSRGARGASPAHGRASVGGVTHSRNASYGGTGLKAEDIDAEGRQSPVVRQSETSPESNSGRVSLEQSTPITLATDKLLPQIPSGAQKAESVGSNSSNHSLMRLKPLIASPTSEEFLVITGKGPQDPGIGMFVNVEGDATRPPLEFAQYPLDLVLDGHLPASPPLQHSIPGNERDKEIFAVASVARFNDDGVQYGLEIQSLTSVDGGAPPKFWLEAGENAGSDSYGLRSVVGSQQVSSDKVLSRLCQRRYMIRHKGAEEPSTLLTEPETRDTASPQQEVSDEEQARSFESSHGAAREMESWEVQQNSEEEAFARQLFTSESRVAVWAGASIWWAVRNPLILRLDAQLGAVRASPHEDDSGVDRHKLKALLAKVRSREATSEMEFMTIGYVQQKGGLLLLTSFLAARSDIPWEDDDIVALQQTLVESKLDARIVISLIPGLSKEITEGARGIWIYGGVKKVADEYTESHAKPARLSSMGHLPQQVLQFLRRFLQSWRRMKGFGSVADEHEVFRTVDAALLVVLLEIDSRPQQDEDQRRRVRAELYDLVDKSVECFDRAVVLLESYHRLYVLSRLYQSRRMASEVLTTWKRIIEGQRDDGNELEDGETRVKNYLPLVSSQTLVHGYGVWLANRNPRLGAQVFAEDKGKAPPFAPAQVLEILKKEAPAAVKFYLEMLVFDKLSFPHIDELIGYYLEEVVATLNDSQAIRDNLLATYAAYRALDPPKPTYQQFFKDNSPEDDEFWSSRSRLLQLLAGTYDYDVVAVRERLAHLSDDLLVPEAIILAGRDGQHTTALRLLVHGLGDYDSAVSYCLQAGSVRESGASDGRAASGAAMLPASSERRQLFLALLGEFLAIRDASDRIEQSGLLLERFGWLFTIEEVLDQIPDGWSIAVVSKFLTGALRRLVSEKNETSLVQALSGSENLKVAYTVVVKSKQEGPRIEAES